MEDDSSSGLDAAIAGMLAVFDREPHLLFDSNRVVWLPKKRARREKVDFDHSEWTRLIRSHEIWTPNSFEAKKFRSRFRVPWILFSKFIVPMCKSVKMFNKVRTSYIPLEIKIMIALRMLGKGNDCDTLEELSGVPKSTVNAIFNTFCEEMNMEFFDKFVYMPEGDELEKLMEVFGKVGFPGACGSMDVTHIRWFRCPKNRHNHCKGKYPFTTLATQAIVDHNRRILFLSDLYDGRENDKTITLDDDFTYSVTQGRLKDVTFKMYDREGVLREYRGGYLIVDGGYQKLPCMIDPMHDACGHKQTHWSEFLESVRKDVECTFGILKARFRILRNGLECKHRSNCNNIVKTCAILHNMLLRYDGLDVFEWEKKSDWESEDPDMDDIDINLHAGEAMDDNETDQPEDRHRPPVRDTTPIGRRFTPWRYSEYNSLRDHLVDHLYYQWLYGKLDWPKRFHDKAKRIHPMNRIRSVMHQAMTDTLYVKAADVVLVHDDTRYDLGKGLFSNILLPAAPQGIRLCRYEGESISENVYKTRTNAGLGGYIIKTGSTLNDPYLDCRLQMQRGICKASRANTALHAFNISTDSPAVNNCDLRVNGSVVTIYTKPNTSIPAHRELLLAYQRGYKFPDPSTMRVWGSSSSSSST